MQGHEQFVDRVVLRFRLSECVPKQNLYHQFAELLDWSFLYSPARPPAAYRSRPPKGIGRNRGNLS